VTSLEEEGEEVEREVSSVFGSEVGRKEGREEEKGRREEAREEEGLRKEVEAWEEEEEGRVVRIRGAVENKRASMILNLSFEGG